jgi:hypothetical protein
VIYLRHGLKRPQRDPVHEEELEIVVTVEVADAVSAQ